MEKKKTSSVNHRWRVSDVGKYDVTHSTWEPRPPSWVEVHIFLLCFLFIIITADASLNDKKGLYGVLRLAFPWINSQNETKWNELNTWKLLVVMIRIGAPHAHSWNFKTSKKYTRFLLVVEHIRVYSCLFVCFSRFLWRNVFLAIFVFHYAYIWLSF